MKILSTCLQTLFPNEKGPIRALLSCSFVNERTTAKTASRKRSGFYHVGITYLPGKSPCKYCRRGRA